MRKTRIAILGVGGIFESHARALIKNTDFAEVVAVANAHINEQVVQRTCSLLKTEKEKLQFFTNYEELLKSIDLDAVIILLPHNLHAPATIYAATRGVHVLVEKPMARSTEECDAMIKAAKENGITLVVCHDRRYNDEWRAVKEIVSSGRIGKPIFYRLEHNQNYAPAEGSWVRSANLLGGGCIMSCLTHQIDALRWIGGEMRNVTCVTKVIPERMEGESIGIIAGQMENGALAELSINWHTISDVSVNTVSPVDNALWFEFIHVCGNMGEVYYLANKGVFLLKYKTFGGANEYVAGVNGFEPYFRGGNVFGHDNIITEWLKMLRGEADNIVTYGCDSRNTIAIAEAAYRSAYTGCVTTVNFKQ